MGGQTDVVVDVAAEVVVVVVVIVVVVVVVEAKNNGRRRHCFACSLRFFFACSFVAGCRLQLSLRPAAAEAATSSHD